MAGYATKTKHNFFHLLTPLQRIFISVAFAASTIFIFPFDTGSYFWWLVLWNVFAVIYLICCWVVLYTLPVQQIKRRASQEDGSKVFVFFMVIISSLAALITITLLVLSQSQEAPKGWQLAITISGMLLSWAMVHTIYTFHYAHLFYNDKGQGGLDFPGDKDEEIDYLDFAYFAFVIGCTFQVSDVEISSKVIRRVAMFHGLLSFMLNTFVVALSINIMASLLPEKKSNGNDKAVAHTPTVNSRSHVGGKIASIQAYHFRLHRL